MPARPFVFSCDAHIAEPPDLFVQNMPKHLEDYAIHGEAEGDIRITKIGSQVILKIQTDFHSHKTGQGDAGPKDSRACTLSFASASSPPGPATGAVPVSARSESRGPRWSSFL